MSNLKKGDKVRYIGGRGTIDKQSDLIITDISGNDEWETVTVDIGNGVSMTVYSDNVELIE